MAIKNVEMIVHPLYGFLKRREWKHMSIRAGNMIYDFPTKLTPQERVIVKNRLSNFGQTIQRVEKNPGSIAILADVNFERETELSKDYRRFLEFARKRLGDRLVVFPAIFAIYPPKGKVKRAIEEAKGALKRFDFASRVNVVVGGQYKEGCVKMAGERIQEILQSDFGRKASFRIRKDSITYGDMVEFRRERTEAYTEFRKWRRRTYGKRKTTPRRK